MPGIRSVTSWFYAILAAGVVFEGTALAIAVRSLRRVKGRRSIAEFWDEPRDPTLLTVLLEDTASLTSLVIAAVGLGLSQRSGNVLWDALASMVIGVEEIVSLHTMHLGPDEIIAVLQIDVCPDLSGPGLEAAIERLHRRVQNALGPDLTARLIAIEPARRRQPARAA
jgi:hypothetical protein